MNATVDRRVARTHRLLAEALIELVLERGYDRVTVQNILDRADVGRSTFYAHFRDKQDLLLSCFDGLRADLRREIDTAAPDGELRDAGRPSLVLFAHAYQHRRVWQALCGRSGGTVVHGHLHELIRASLSTYLGTRPETARPVPPEAVAEFATSALLGLLTWWVGQDFPYPPSQMARTYGLLATPAIRAAVQAPGPHLADATPGRRGPRPT